MDQFEPIRIKAATLHGELLADGQDPFDLLALVQAAVAHREIDLVWLPHGDPALKGARALFDDQGGTICCEDEGDATTRALLVAHELGHSELHAGSAACAHSDVDPSRSTEAAPVGLQRVEDYGARERRELQANVYARELVLPRPFVHDLHVSRDLTAAAIADRTNLPVALIRQQILDALLLPIAVAEAETEPVQPAARRPDPSQDRAAAYRGKPFQLQAGPGTGKTRTLVKRVLSLLAEGIDPAAILILTFSNRAAGELSERLTAAAPEAAPKLWIGTFHAFGLDLVRRYHDRLGLSANPSLFDRSDAIEVLEDILPTIEDLRRRHNPEQTAVWMRNLMTMARGNGNEDAKRGLMPIVRQLVQSVVIGKTPCHQPASLQVHGLIAAIFAQMDVMDLMEQQFIAAAQNDFVARVASGEIDTDAKRKKLLDRYGEELKSKYLE